MEATAASIAPGAASPTRLAVQMRPTPSALVRMSLSPGFPVSLAVRRRGSTSPVTDRPYFTPVSAMECPPARMPPASAFFPRARSRRRRSGPCSPGNRRGLVRSSPRHPWRRRRSGRSPPRSGRRYKGRLPSAERNPRSAPVRCPPLFYRQPHHPGCRSPPAGRGLFTAGQLFQNTAQRSGAELGGTSATGAEHDLAFVLLMHVLLSRK